MKPQDQKDYLAQKLQRQVNADTLNEASRLLIKAALYIDRVSKAGNLCEQDAKLLSDISSLIQVDATKLIELGDAYVSNTAS